MKIKINTNYEVNAASSFFDRKAHINQLMEQVFHHIDELGCSVTSWNTFGPTTEMIVNEFTVRQFEHGEHNLPEVHIVIPDGAPQ